MGLFGHRVPTLVHSGGFEEHRFVEALLKDQARDLEREFRETPIEYLILQSAGMLVAGRLGGVDPDIVLGKLDFVDDEGRMQPTCASAIAVAQGILRQHQCEVVVTSVIEERCATLASVLEQAVWDGKATNTAILAALHDLLNFYEGHLPARRASQSVPTSQPLATQSPSGGRLWLLVVGLAVLAVLAVLLSVALRR